MKVVTNLVDSDIEYVTLKIGKTWTTMHAIFEGRIVDKTKYLTGILNPWHVTAVLEGVITPEQKEDIESYIIKKLGLDKKKNKNDKSKRRSADVPETVIQSS